MGQMKTVPAFITLVLVSAHGLWAQTPVTPVVPPPASTAGAAVGSEAPAAAPGKIEQMEATYRESLKARHLPLIQQYLTELRTAQTRALTMEEKSAYAAEMARVAKMVTEGGIVSPRTAEPAPVVSVPAASPMGRGVVFSLDPHEALPAQPEGAESVPLGSATWTLSKLQPGTYDVVAEYSCPAVPEGGSIRIDYAGLQENKALRPTHATKDAATVRLLRIGRLVLKQEVLGAQMTISAAPDAAPWFSVRRILLSRAEKQPAD